MISEQEEKYKNAKEERKKHTNNVLNHPSRYKVVVAGPGTGKTFLFKKVLSGKTKTLTLTFVKTLVEDLSLELCGLSKVKTLHGFARGKLAEDTEKKVAMFSKLPEVIEEDLWIIKRQKAKFDYIFHNCDDKKPELIDFYEERRDYYNYYGFDDVIFAVVKAFKEDKSKIPEYEQIVVDEFQDFNKLEVLLIKLLSEKSPVLLAGDDDQAIYDFRHTSADHIRDKHSESCSEYASFNLPFCSRCTRVIVEATNAVIAFAENEGCLENRIKKPYRYFESKKKDEESKQNPKIIYSQFFSSQIPWFIEKEIMEIAKERRSNFSVLLISPLKDRLKEIVYSLRKKGFENIDFEEKKDNNPSLMDGLVILLDDKKSNLGWRIATKHLLSEPDFESLIEKSNNSNKPLCEFIPKESKKEINEMLKVCKNCKDKKKGKVIDEAKLAEVLTKAGFKPDEILKNFLRSKINSNSPRTGNRALRKIPIKATTIQGSKGLAADIVFITHFDDCFFVKNNKNKTQITDQDIRQLLVALTRAKRKIFLISSQEQTPTFLNWIGRSRIGTTKYSS